MKEFAAFIVLIVLIIIGWKQPYRSHFISVVGETPEVVTPEPATPKPTQNPTATPAARANAPQATPTRSAAWIYEKTTMDAQNSTADKKGGGKHGR